MLLRIVLVNVLLFTSLSVRGEGRVSRPYVLPVPFELPNRNERAEQCWVRIEDADIIETVSTFCDLTHEFLLSFIPEYNSRKMGEDGVEVSPWNEELRAYNVPQPPKVASTGTDQKPFLDWRETTIWDPIIRMRFYVSQTADCKLVVSNREAMTNYKVDCDKLLYFVNLRLHSGAATRINTKLVVVISVIFTLIIL